MKTGLSDNKTTNETNKMNMNNEIPVFKNNYKFEPEMLDETPQTRQLKGKIVELLKEHYPALLADNDDVNANQLIQTHFFIIGGMAEFVNHERKANGETKVEKLALVLKFAVESLNSVAPKIARAYMDNICDPSTMARVASDPTALIVLPMMRNLAEHGSTSVGIVGTFLKFLPSFSDFPQPDSEVLAAAFQYRQLVHTVMQ